MNDPRMSSPTPAFGCLAALALAVILIIGGNLAAGYASDRAADRTRAEATIIRAESQARLTAATANAITAATVMPFVVFGGILIVALVVIVAVAVVVIKVSDSRPEVVQQPPQIIQRQIIYLPAPGASRRDVWQALAAGFEPEIMILPERVKVEVVK